MEIITYYEMYIYDNRLNKLIHTETRYSLADAMEFSYQYLEHRPDMQIELYEEFEGRKNKMFTLTT